jgi:FMN phosphatase YigB (HAD superfamily)
MVSHHVPSPPQRRGRDSAQASELRPSDGQSGIDFRQGGSLRSTVPTTDVDVILFDFGGTLAEEVDSLFLDDVPATWHNTWNARFLEPGFVERWERGELDATTLVAELAGQFSAEPELIRYHIQQRCQAIVFNSGIMEAARRRKARGHPQAIVTVNPDLFSLIADHYRLHDLFDSVVLSALEGTIDKVELCRIALDRIGRREVSSALLIDNNKEQVRAFEQSGGQAYLFVNDATFLTDVASGRLPKSLAR